MSAPKVPLYPFPETPWPNSPRDQYAKDWRNRSSSSIRHIVEAISPKYAGLCADNINPRSAAGRMTDAIFQESARADPADRLALIAWLGGACGFVTEDVARPWQVRGSLGLVDRTLIDEWTMSLWREAPDKIRPVLENFPFEILEKGIQPVSSAHQRWGTIPAGWEPGTAHAQTNAQMDMVTFLSAFEQQTGRHFVPFEKPSAYTAQNRIAHCCVALRILSSTTDLVDPLLLKHLNFFESLYDHQHIDMELLKLAGAAGDLKILTAAVSTVHEDTSGANRMPGGRKL